MKRVPLPELAGGASAYYRDLKRRHVFRLLLTYVLPIVLLTIYFLYQYRSLVVHGRLLHLEAIAENQANTLDLFLSERRVNLENLIDDPRFEVPPTPHQMTGYLRKLQMNSEAYVDLGFFDSSGVQAAYAGPYLSLERRDYSLEPWWQSLREQSRGFLITDIYLGFRQAPHFTIAVGRTIDNRYVVLRATLDPRKIYEYIESRKGVSDAHTAIVNGRGEYQVVTPQMGAPLEGSPYVPPANPAFGLHQTHGADGDEVAFAYAWLPTAGWAVVVKQAADSGSGLSGEFLGGFLGISAVVALLIVGIILNRAKRLVEMQRETDRTRAELGHAAKLASVGELAAGIAHEINNPLAVINEQAGLMKDLMDPQFGPPPPVSELTVHLEIIHSAVFRCRDITRKLLGFVRKTEVKLEPHDVHQLIDDVVEGLLGHEITVSNVQVIKSYAGSLPPLVTDGNQLEQVLLNIINNAIDALEGRPGSVAISTRKDERWVYIALADTGKGMTPEQMENIFMPFYTTKEVGKGTGLGLSVSYGIVKSLGGRLTVESEPGRGSTFTVTLPLNTSETPQPGKPSRTQKTGNR